MTFVLRLRRFLLFHSLVSVSAVGAVSAQDGDWLKRGMVEYNSGQYVQAVSSLSMAVNKDGESDLAHYYLANALLRIGHKARALQEYEKACNASRSREMYVNCAQVLKTYNLAVPPPPASIMSSRRRLLDDYQVSSMDKINALAAQRNDGRQKFVDSHQGGLEVFRCSPEETPELKPAWDKWIENFRLAFGSTLGPSVRAARIGKLSGSALMVFSVDKNRRLRGRLVKSDAPVLFNYYLLDTTRRLDHSALLDFPSGSALPGYNFTMTWDYGGSKSGTDTVAELIRTEAYLRNQQALVARAVALNGSGRGTGSLAAAETDASLMPKFDSKVSARLLVPSELRATAGTLKP